MLKSVQEALASGRAAAAGGLNASVVGTGDHRIKTTVDVSITTSMQDDKGTITIKGRNVVVDFKKGQVLLDDIEKAKISTTTKEVELRYVGGKLSLTADGMSVWETSELK